MFRFDFLDLWSEYMALSEYHNWVFDSGRAAIFCGDREKEKFSEDLINAIFVNLFVLFDVLKYEKVFGRD